MQQTDELIASLSGVKKKVDFCWCQKKSSLKCSLTGKTITEILQNQQFHHVISLYLQTQSGLQLTVALPVQTIPPTGMYGVKFIAI